MVQTSHFIKYDRRGRSLYGRTVNKTGILLS